MGRNTQNYRQTNSSRAGGRGAQSYATIQREGNWFKKIKDLVNVRGKNRPNI